MNHLKDKFTMKKLPLKSQVIFPVAFHDNTSMQENKNKEQQNKSIIYAVDVAV